MVKEWLVTFQEGDFRIFKGKNGKLKLNETKKAIEFIIESEERIVSYPVNYLVNVEVFQDKKWFKEVQWIRLTCSGPISEISPLFSLRQDNDYPNLKNEIEQFKEKLEEKKQGWNLSIFDPISLIARIFKKQVEQVQQLIVRSPNQKLDKQSIVTVSTLDLQEQEIDDRIVRYYDSKTTNNRILILLHPVGGHVNDLSRMIPRLTNKKSHRVIFPFLRGHDRTRNEKIKDFSLKKYCEDLKSFLEFIGSDKEVVLGGTSLSAVIVLSEFLRPSYDFIDGYIIVSSPAHVPSSVRHGIKALPPPPFWNPLKREAIKMAPVLFSKEVEEKFVKGFIDNALTIPDKTYYRIIKDWIPKLDFLEQLSQLRKPLLLIQGKSDQIVPSELYNEYSNRIKTDLFSRVIIEGGHLLPIENPEELAINMSNFVSNLN
ncbi:MAG: alpha/beta fold hydrolase [Candidatus Hodarchaeales archaeon]|jgi:pimeloyl-ACP methyl ester carboxylesterase